MGSRKVDLRIGSGDVSKDVSVTIDDATATPWGSDARLAVVGTDVARVDGAVKASGAAKYTYDVSRPGLAFARIARSPHAHARVKAVGLDAVKTMPGVLAAISLQRDVVTFAGAPVAAICAETEARLDDALAALRIEYEVLPHVVDATEAQAENAPRVTAGKPNAAATRRRTPRRSHR